MSQKRKAQQLGDQKLTIKDEQHNFLKEIELDAVEDFTDEEDSDYELDEENDQDNEVPEGLQHLLLADSDEYESDNENEEEEVSDTDYDEEESDADNEEEESNSEEESDSENEDEESDDFNSDSNSEQESDKNMNSDKAESIFKKKSDTNLKSKNKDDFQITVMNKKDVLTEVNGDKNKSNKKNISSTQETKHDRSPKDKGSSAKKSQKSGTVKDNLLKSDSKVDEYAHGDSSDEEDLRNTIGNIPINWYDEYPHVGYNLEGKPILKPETGDKLDKFLTNLENSDSYRTVLDKLTGQEVVLSDADLDLVHRVMNHKVADSSYNMYEPFPDLYSHEEMIMPLSGRPEHKKSFLPSMNERRKVAVLVGLMKRGIYMKKKYKKKNEFYDIWKPRSKYEGRIRKIKNPIPPPIFPMPGHAESYNPPPEYLMTKLDTKALQGKAENPEMYKGFWRKFKSVRQIPMYPKTVEWHYTRLQSLQYCPRKIVQRVVGKSEDLLPNLPDKKDLRPFPTMQELVFKGHQSIIRTISIHSGGKYLASGSDDNTVRIWEINTARCLRTFEMDDAVLHVSWNPNPKLFVLAVVVGRMVVLLSPENYLLDKIVVRQTNELFQEEVNQGDYIVPPRIAAAVTWRKPTEEEWTRGYRLVLDHFKEVKSVVWHRQGDYFSTVIPEGLNRSVLIHQLSRWRSQVPFSKSKGRVQCVSFHPKKPQIFVITQTHIRVYDLLKTRLIKKIQSNCRYISCLAIHPGGEHFIIGGFDRKTNWFETEYTKRPHLMRYHSAAVRAVKFHRKYPLFATCSDDGRIVITHATVYDDWVKDPLIVPLKSLKGHQKFNDYVALDLEWHPFEPYLLSAGADSTIRLWH